jgi:chitodextrinase
VKVNRVISKNFFCVKNNRYIVVKEFIIETPVRVTLFGILLLGSILGLTFSSFLNNNGRVSALSVPASIPNDCSVDVSSQLSDWISNVGGTGAPAGSIISFPAHSCYLIEKSLKVQSTQNITIEGNGATLERTGLSDIAVSDVRPLLFLLQNSHLTINNLNINGSYDGNNYGGPAFEGHDGIQLESNNNTIINSVNVNNVQGDGISLQFDSGGKLTNGDKSINYHTVVTNSKFNNVGYHGITFEAVNGATFNNDTFSNVAVDGIDAEYDLYPTGFDSNGNPQPAADNNIYIVNNNWINCHYTFFVSAQGQGVPEQNVVVSGNKIESSQPLFGFGGASETKLPSKYWTQGLFIQNNTFTSSNGVSYTARALFGGSIAASKPVDMVMNFKNVNDLNISNNNFPVADGTPTYYHNTPYLSALNAEFITNNNFNSTTKPGLNLVNNNFDGAYNIFYPTSTSNSITNECGNSFFVTDAAKGITAQNDGACASPAPACPPGEVGDPGSCYFPAPHAPTNVSASASGANTVNVSWDASTDSSNTVVGYYILRSEAGQSHVVVGCITTSGPVISDCATATSATFIDKTASPNSVYSYQVEGFDQGSTTDPNIAANVSPLSNDTNADQLTTPNSSIVPPSVPTNVTATAVSPDQVNLNWAPSSDSTGTLGGYFIVRDNQVIGSVTANPSTGVIGHNYSDYTVQSGVVYTYTIEAYDTNTPVNFCAESGSVNNSTGCAASSFATVTLPIYPSIPGNVTIANDASNSATSLDLAWTGSTDSSPSVTVSGYYIINSSTGTTVAIVPASNCANCSFVITGLIANSSYSYKIEAYDNSSQKNTSFPSKIVTATTFSGVTGCNPPSIPGNLSVKSFTATNIIISWSASIEPSQTVPGCSAYTVAGYYVYNNTSSGRVLLDTVTSGATAKDNLNTKAIIPNTTYNISLVAFDSNHPQDLSTETPQLNVTTIASTVTPPTTPRNFTTAANTSSPSSAIDLSWSSSTDAKFSGGAGGILGYDIYRIAPGSSTAELIAPGSLVSGTTTVAQNVASYTDHGDNNIGLIPGSSYGYYIVAVDISTPTNYSVPSSTLNASTSSSAIPKPSSPVLDPITSYAYNRVDLSWSVSTDPSPGPGIGGYNIWRSTATGSPQYIDSAGASTTTYSDANVLPNTDYQYYIVAYDSTPQTANLSLPSNSQIVSTSLSPLTPPNPPTNLIITSSTSNQASLSWTAATQSANGTAIAGYAITKNGVVLFTIADPSVTSYNVTGLVPGSQYSFSVIAYDSSLSSLSSSPSNVVDLNTPNIAIPSTPTNLRQTAFTRSTLSFTWDASGETNGTISGYDIYRDDVKIGNTTGTSYVDNNLAADTSYRYQITSYDTTGTNSQQSSPLVIKTDLVGDLDNDGYVSGHDLSILLSNYGTNYVPAEFDGASPVGQSDLSQLLGNYGKSR